MLWERSLHRSQGRRERARRARRNAPRQKGVTIAAGAAILASPVLAPLGAAASSARPGVTKTEVAEKAAVSGETTALLSYGDTGDAVKAVQHELQIVEDGIFGPQTEAAVKSWQRGQGLAVTGIVDAKTWASLFQAKVLFYGESSSSGTATPSAYDGGATSTPAEAAASESVGGPDLSDRVELKDEITSDPAPAPEAAPSPEAAPEPTPVSTGGDGCATDGRIVAPVQGGTITGEYGEDRGDHAHSGTDIAVPTGTTVRAADCGTVSVSGEESGYGQMVCVQHAGGNTTCYAHLSERDVSVSEYVKAGQKIGEVGCTGSCTGPHVHFEVRHNGTATDPSPYLEGARSVNGQTVTMAESSGGIGGATPAQQAEVFGATGGTAAPTATKHHQLARISPPAQTTTTAPTSQTGATTTAPAATAPTADETTAAPVEDATGSAPVEEAPAPAPVEDAPAPAPVEAAPVEDATGSAPVEEAPAPAPVEEAPAPAPVEEAPAPAPVEEAPAPAPVEEAPAPAPEASAPAPAAEAPAAAPAEEPAAEAPAVQAPAPAAEPSVPAVQAPTAQGSADGAAAGGAAAP